MSKYSVAKTQLALAAQAATADGLDPVDVLEALVVTAIQDLATAKGASYTKDFLRYEIDNVSSDGVFEIQKR